MIDCPNGDVRDLLPEYLNDRLAPARRAEVESHLAGCEACREELALLGDLRATMRRAPIVDVAAIAAAIPPYRAPVRRTWGSDWRVAAAIAAIAVGGTSIALLQQSGSTTTRALGPRDTAVSAPQVTRESTTSVAVGPTEVSPGNPVVETPRTRGQIVVTQPAGGRELAMAGGALGDLSDGELSTLLSDIESLDAVPSTDVEGAEPISPSRDGGLR
jgi:anti-sigma factor RsiW